MGSDKLLKSPTASSIWRFTSIVLELLFTKSHLPKLNYNCLPTITSIRMKHQKPGQCLIHKCLHTLHGGLMGNAILCCSNLASAVEFSKQQQIDQSEPVALKPIQMGYVSSRVSSPSLHPLLKPVKWVRRSRSFCRAVSILLANEVIVSF